VGHFDGHAESLEQYRAHHPIQHDQGFTGSHWTPSSGRATVAITASYRLGQVSEGTEYPQLAFANAIALIIIIAILYSTRPAPLAKKNTPLVRE